MEFPEKFKKYGKFKLHSGQKSSIFYDINAMLTDGFYVEYILNKIPFNSHYVGIATGGAIIASLISRERNSKFSMVKDGELKGASPLRNWLLIDDVVTTGASLEEALKIINKNPSEIVVVLDRRPKNENPKVYSIFEI